MLTHQAARPRAGARAADAAGGRDVVHGGRAFGATNQTASVASGGDGATGRTGGDAADAAAHQAACSIADAAGTDVGRTGAAGDGRGLAVADQPAHPILARHAGCAARQTRDRSRRVVVADDAARRAAARNNTGGRNGARDPAGQGVATDQSTNPSLTRHTGDCAAGTAANQGACAVGLADQAAHGVLARNIAGGRSTAHIAIAAPGQAACSP